MRRVNLLILIITAMTIAASCNKNEAVSMRWDLTGCSNPWDNHINLDTFTTQGYNQAIYDFLKVESIDVNYVSSELDSSKVELCLACHCKTGQVIIINIPRRDRRKLKKLAPNNQFDLDFY